MDKLDTFMAYLMRGFIAVASMWIMFMLFHYISLYPIEWIRFGAVFIFIVSVCLFLGWFIKEVMKL